MESVVLVIHLILALGIIVVVLIQPSEGGGLGGMGGGNGGFGGLTTARGATNLLSRLTAIFVAGFIVTSLTLAILAGHSGEKASILEAIPADQQADMDADQAIDTMRDISTDVAVPSEKLDDKMADDSAPEAEPEIPVSQ